MHLLNQTMNACVLPFLLMLHSPSSRSCKQNNRNISYTEVKQENAEKKPVQEIRIKLFSRAAIWQLRYIYPQTLKKEKKNTSNWNVIKILIKFMDQTPTKPCPRAKSQQNRALNASFNVLNKKFVEIHTFLKSINGKEPTIQQCSTFVQWLSYRVLIGKKVINI